MGDDRQERQQVARDYLIAEYGPHLAGRRAASLALMAILDQHAAAAAPARLHGDDVRAALALTPAARAELDAAELHLIQAARAAGCTWTEIAAELGLRSRQHAQLQYKALAKRVADASTPAPAGPAPATPTHEPVKEPLTPAAADPGPVAVLDQDDTDVPHPPAAGRPAEPAPLEDTVNDPLTPPARPGWPPSSRWRRPRAAPAPTDDHDAATEDEANDYDVVKVEDGRYHVTYQGELIGRVSAHYGHGRRRQWEPRSRDNTRLSGARKRAYPTVKAAAVEVAMAHELYLERQRREKREQRRRRRPI